MTFRSPFRASQYAKLRKPASGIRSWSGSQFVDFDPCTVVFAARVNGALTADTPFAQITFDGITTGAYTDIEADQVVIVSPTNDTRDPLALRLRVREEDDGTVATASTINHNEISYAIGDDWYIFGLKTFDATDKLAKPINATLQKKDFNRSYAPLPPTVRGLQLAYAGMVAASGKYRVYFNLTIEPRQIGATISSWAFTFGSGTDTVVAGAKTGSGTSAYLIVDVTPGWQWAKFVATDSNGQVCRRHFVIAAHDNSVYPVSDIAFNGAQIGATIDQGWTATFDAFDGVEDVLNGTFCVIWTDAYYNNQRTSVTGPQPATVSNKALTSNVATLTTSAAHYFEVGAVVSVSDVGAPFDGNWTIASVPTSTTFTFACTNANVVSAAATGTAIVYRNNMDMVGWLEGETNNTENDPVSGIIPAVQFRVSGVAARIAEVEAQMLAVRTAASPIEWDEIAGLTPQRAVIHYLHRHTTLMNLCDWYDDDDGTDIYEFPYVAPQGTNITDSIRGIASAINAHIEFGPTGEIQMVRDLRFGNSATRAAIVPVADYTEEDMFAINEYTFDHYDKVGKVDFAGAFYNASSGNTQAFRARAPGYAQGSGAGSSSRTDQILALDVSASVARDELRQRVGNQERIENKTRKLGMKQPDGYGYGVPSYAEVYTWTLDTTYSKRNLTLTTADKWLLEGITINHDNTTGTREIDWNYTNLTPIGDLGDDIPPIAEGEIPSFELPPLGDLSFPDIPAPEIGWLPDEVPSPAALTPSAGQIAFLDGNTMLFWDSAGAGLWSTGTAAKLRSPRWREITPDLASDYAISCAMWDVFYNNAATPAYALAYDSTDSRVYYTGNGAAGAVVYVEGTAYDGFYKLIRPTSTRGTVLIYSPGVSSTSISPTYSSGASGPATIHVGDTFDLTLGAASDPCFNYNGQMNLSECCTFELVSFNGLTVSPCCGISIAISAYVPCGGSLITNPICSYTFPSGTSISQFGLNSMTAGSVTLRLVSIDDASDSAKIRVSSDYGLTFGGAVTVGATPGVRGGFDVQYIGSVNYAAMAGKVRKATTHGGAYSDHTTYGGNPVCIVIPWARRSATDTGNLAVSNPDYLVAEDDGTLWWVNGITAAKTNITPAGVTACNSANAISTWSGYIIRYVGIVSGTPHLFTSVNAGSSWSDRGAITNASFVRGRRKRTSNKDTTAINQLFVMGGASLKYSASQGATLVDRTKPSSSGGGVDILG